MLISKIVSGGQTGVDRGDPREDIVEPNEIYVDDALNLDADWSWSEERDDFHYELDEVVDDHEF